MKVGVVFRDDCLYEFLALLTVLKRKDFDVQVYGEGSDTLILARAICEFKPPRTLEDFTLDSVILDWAIDLRTDRIVRPIFDQLTLVDKTRRISERHENAHFLHEFWQMAGRECTSEPSDLAISCLVRHGPSESSIDDVAKLRESCVQANVDAVMSLCPTSITAKSPRGCIKSIHQMWLSANPILDHSSPLKYHNYEAQWRALNPNATYKMWHEPDVLQLIDEHYSPEIKRVFLQIRPVVAQADFARVLVVHALGGFYVDADFMPVRPLDAWDLVGHGESEGPQDPITLFREISEHSRDFRVINGCFACEKPGHPFLKKLIDTIMTNAPQITHRSRVMDLTGPTCWTRVLREWTTTPEAYVLPGWRVMPYTNAQQISRDVVERSSNKAWAYTWWNEGSNWNEDAPNDGLSIVYIALVIQAALLVSLVVCLTSRRVQWASQPNRLAA